MKSDELKQWLLQEHFNDGGISQESWESGFSACETHLVKDLEAKLGVAIKQSKNLARALDFYACENDDGSVARSALARMKEGG